jgi:hypothetical protein
MRIDGFASKVFNLGGVPQLKIWLEKGHHQAATSGSAVRRPEARLPAGHEITYYQLVGGRSRSFSLYVSNKTYDTVLENKTIVECVVPTTMQTLRVAR